MQVRINILNVTNEDLKLALTNSSDATIPQPQYDILATKPLQLIVEGGTKNLYVWKKDKDILLWKGPIPTTIKKPIHISSDNGTLTIKYDNMVLPNGFSATTSIPTQNNTTSYKWIWISLIFLIIIIIGWFYIKK